MLIRSARSSSGLGRRPLKAEIAGSPKGTPSKESLTQNSMTFTIMYYAYILKSFKDNTHYYGSTENLNERVSTHNAGKVRYTRGHIPYTLHFYETFKTRKEAIARERFYKSISGYKWLKSKGII